MLVEIEDGVEGLEKFKAGTFDLVILDLKLPKKDGLELLGDIKAVDPNATVIIITGYQSASLAEKAIRLGAKDYLTKPFEKESLRKTVRELVS